MFRPSFRAESPKKNFRQGHSPCTPPRNQQPAIQNSERRYSDAPGTDETEAPVVAPVDPPEAPGTDGATLFFTCAVII